MELRLEEKYRAYIEDKAASLPSTQRFLLRLQSRLYRRHFLIQWQNVNIRSKRSDRIRIDLLVTLGVVLLDMRELRRASKSVVVPVEVAHPSVNQVSAME